MGLIDEQRAYWNHYYWDARLAEQGIRTSRKISL